MAQRFSKAFYNSKLWQDTREYIMQRDVYLCRICGAPAEEVHHIEHLTPENIKDPQVTVNPKNLISLCKDCHFTQHGGDKRRGIQAKSRQLQQSEYEFDENGMLIRRAEPPGY